MICIIDCGSSKTFKIHDVLTDLGFDSTVVPMYKTAPMAEANGYIISGAPILLSQTNPIPYLDLFKFLNKISVPVLGICFGHQVLGLLNGAEIFLGKAERSPVLIELLDESDLFKDLPLNTIFDQDHTEGISLPLDFLHLGKSKNYKNEAMKHASKPFYGIQFHPETSGENGKKVLRNFANICCKVL